MSKVYRKDSDQKLQALVHKMAKAKLNITKNFCGQDMKVIKQICNVVSYSIIHHQNYHYHFVTKVQKEYGILKDYEQDWPIRDMLKLHLKYTSEASHRLLTASTAKQLEKVH
jgi:hypothetical protein